MKPQRKGHNGAELVGRTFGRLTVLARAENNKHGNRRWLCQCACGKASTPISAQLLSGHTKSCGCAATDAHTTHGRYRTPEYNIWAQMKHRCHNEDGATYGRYGGRGIYVCEAWRESFAVFLKGMGPRPSPEHTVERIDNDGPYSPENCKWGTWDEQYRNRRQTVWIEFRGERKCKKDWCQEFGLDEGTFGARLRRGWDLERALTLPALATNRNGRAKVNELTC